MVLFNYATKELTAKVVYYGAGLCGKTTNLQWIHEKLAIKNKGKMLSLATETDRTLFFDFLPIELGTIRGMKTRIQLYTVPGQVFYNATRRMVLKGADCVVFVCDSQEPMLDANVESMENLRQNLEANEIDPEAIPMVLQFNKRDLPNALPIEILSERLNPRGLPSCEAVAIKGDGVEATLKAATALVFKSLAAKYGDNAAVAAASPARSPETPPNVRTDTPPLVAPMAPPPPRPPERRPAAALATIPPVDASAKADDELLESLELEPAEAAFVVDTEVEEAEAVEELPLEVENEFSTTDPLPQPPLAAPVSATADHFHINAAASSAPTAIASDGPVLALEAEEDIALDPNTGPVPVTRQPAVAAPVEKPAPLVIEPTLQPPRLQRVASPSALPAPTAPPGAARPTLIERPTTIMAPVTVSAPVEPGHAEVAIPIEIALDNGTALVTLQLRLTLHLKQR